MHPDGFVPLRFLGTRYRRGVRSTAMNTIATLIEDAEDSPRRTSLQRDFIDAVRPALQDVDYRVRQYAVDAYRAAHADDLDDLRRLIASSTVADERDAAAEVLAGHRNPTEEENPLEKRVKSLELDRDATEERLEALEIWRR